MVTWTDHKRPQKPLVRTSSGVIFPEINLALVCIFQCKYNKHLRPNGCWQFQKSQPIILHLAVVLLGFWGFFLALRYKKNCQLYHVVVTLCDSCRIDSHNETLCLSLALPHFLPYLLSLSHTLSLAFSHSLSLSPVFFHHIPRDSGLCPRCFSLFNSKLSFSTTCQSVISALRKKRKKQKRST